jgi:hypothetical protein
LELFELSSGERHQERTLSLQLTVLGAYHDGYIELRYPKVFSYALNLTGGNRAIGIGAMTNFVFPTMGILSTRLNGVARMARAHGSLRHRIWISGGSHESRGNMEAQKRVHRLSVVDENDCNEAQPEVQ